MNSDKPDFDFSKSGETLRYAYESGGANYHTSVPRLKGQIKDGRQPITPVETHDGKGHAEGGDNADVGTQRAGPRAPGVTGKTRSDNRDTSALAEGGEQHMSQYRPVTSSGAGIVGNPTPSNPRKHRDYRKSK